jgi:hypothetical protein
VKAYPGLFARAYLISVLQSAGVLLISNESLAAGLTGYLISRLWFGNSQRANDHRTVWAARWYGFGGACGTLTPIVLKRCLR